jgi:hypothetical protein
MREIRLYGSEGGGAARSPYPYHKTVRHPLCPADQLGVKTRRGGREPKSFGFTRNEECGHYIL